MTAPTTLPTKTKAHCNTCSGETNHEILHVERTTWEDERYGVTGIGAFEKLGYVSTRQRERLEAILEAGHAAIHRAYEPTRDDVVTLIDLTEHIVQTVYLHEPRIAELAKRVPARPKKDSAAKAEKRKSTE